MISSLIGNTEIITPPIETLVDIVNHDDLVCSVGGCEKKMRNASSLRLHIVKSHGIGTLGKKEPNGKTLMYACPILGCPRHASSQRQHFFRILYRLKLHYLSQHAEKKFTCVKCSKQFGSFEIKERHMGRCHQLFYCSCGTYYTTRNAVLTHAKRKGSGHILIEGDKETKQQLKQEVKNTKISLPSLQTITIPAVLYIHPSQSLKTNKKNSCFNSNQVEILPKIDSVFLHKNNMSANEKSINMESNTNHVHPSDALTAPSADGDSMSDKLSISKCYSEKNDSQKSLFDFNIDRNVKTAVIKLNKLSNFVSKSSNKVLDLRQMSKYEKRMLYLASQEAQEVLSDPLLLKMTLLKQQQQQETKKQIKKAHILSKKNILAEHTVQTRRSHPKTIDCYGELGSSAASLAKICCITPNNFEDIDPGMQKSNLIHKSSELSQSCDFSMQCKLSLHPENIFSLDEETQTDSLISWLSEFNDSCNMETQTVEKLIDSDILFLDKSIQLDDFLLNESSMSDQIADSSNIGTQTQNVDDSWLSENFNEVFTIEQNSSATQTDADYLYLNIDFSRTKNELLQYSYIPNRDDNIPSTNTFGTQTFSTEHQQIHSSGTQTFDLLDLMLDETMKNNETQTPLSFCDLVDSFITEEYLNVQTSTFTNKPANFIG